MTYEEFSSMVDARCQELEYGAADSVGQQFSNGLSDALGDYLVSMDDDARLAEVTQAISKEMEETLKAFDDGNAFR
ncbi:MAG: hypothetical protein WCK65_04180 [Rhodospirillaceae bacterium]